VKVWDLPRTAESAATGRDAVAEILKTWGASAFEDSAALIVSELVGNTVRYGRGTDAAADIVQLRLLLLDGTVTIEVYDGSEATPRVRHPALNDEFGRGLQLVAATAQQWGTRYTDRGKVVWAVPADL
jgi:anti-sigma regulatory factor (Ser/Thr protein kinase)